MSREYPYAEFPSAAMKKKYVEKIIEAAGKRLTKISPQKIALYEKALASGIMPNYLIPHTRAEIGSTLFLDPKAKAIQAGDFFGVYSGNIIAIVKDSNKEGDYFLTLADEITINKKKYTVLIEGNRHGNYTSKVNHSSTHPNLEFVMVKLDHLQGEKECPIQIALFATRKIKPGEQLLINYGVDYWNNLNFTPYQLTDKTMVLTKAGTLQESPTSDWFCQTKAAMKTLANCRFPWLHTKKAKGIYQEYADDILERGIPRNLYLKKVGNRYRVFVREDAKPIPAGTFLGALHPDNFTKFIGKSKTCGNVQTKSYQKETYLIATRLLKPGEELQR